MVYGFKRPRFGRINLEFGGRKFGCIYNDERRHTVDEVKRVKPKEYVTEQLRWYISTNKLGPHAKIPSERELCDMWHANRSTLRAAVKKLIEEGVLYSEAGSGTFVAPPKFTLNLKDAKSMTEAFRGTGNYLFSEVIKTELIEADSELSLKLDINTGDKVFMLKRIRTKNSIPFRLEEIFLNYALCEGIENESFTDESLYRILKNYGLNVSHGYENIGIHFATKEEAGLPDIGEGTFLFGLEGVIKDIDERPVEVFKILNRADLVRFKSLLKMSVDDEE